MAGCVPAVVHRPQDAPAEHGYRAHPVPMDSQQLLRDARAEAGLSQSALARAAGTSRSTVVAYETGAMSPTVRQLTRLLRACGLQARTTLEPLAADLDRTLQAALDDPAPPPLEELVNLARSLEEHAVGWALDGLTALALHGLCLPHHYPCIAIVDEPKTRAWLRHVWAHGHDRHGFDLLPNWEEPPELTRVYLRKLVYTRLGFATFRLVDTLPVCLPVCLPVSAGELVVPVLPLLHVELASPQLADLLTRWRERPPSATGSAA